MHGMRCGCVQEEGDAALPFSPLQSIKKHREPGNFETLANWSVRHVGFSVYVHRTSFPLCCTKATLFYVHSPFMSPLSLSSPFLLPCPRTTTSSISLFASGSSNSTLCAERGKWLSRRRGCHVRNMTVLKHRPLSNRVSEKEKEEKKNGSEGSL